MKINSITTLSDESYLIENPFGLIKYIDKSGNIIWERGSGTLFYRIMGVDKEDKTVILCEENALGCSLIKIDSSGNELFRKEQAKFDLVMNHILVIIRFPNLI